MLHFWPSYQQSAYMLHEVIILDLTSVFAACKYVNWLKYMHEKLCFWHNHRCCNAERSGEDGDGAHHNLGGEGKHDSGHGEEGEDQSAIPGPEGHHGLILAAAAANPRAGAQAAQGANRVRQLPCVHNSRCNRNIPGADNMHCMTFRLSLGKFNADSRLLLW